jgi:hypothetical protein
LACACKKHPIRVEEIPLTLFSVDPNPLRAAKLSKLPAMSRVTEIGIPRHAHPIDLEPLDGELGGRVLKVE